MIKSRAGWFGRDCRSLLVEQPGLPLRLSPPLGYGPKPPSVAEIRHTLTGFTPPAFYAKVTGTGITPIGQSASLSSRASAGSLRNPSCSTSRQGRGGPPHTSAPVTFEILGPDAFRAGNLVRESGTKGRGS